MTIQDQRDEWVAYLDRHGPDEMPLSMQEAIPMLTRVLALVEAAEKFFAGPSINSAPLTWRANAVEMEKPLPT